MAGGPAPECSASSRSYGIAALAVLAATAMRLGLAAGGVGAALEGRIEVGTPANSLPRLREGAFLLRHMQMSPYSGSQFHAPPLLLLLADPSSPPPSSAQPHPGRARYVLPFLVADIATGGLTWLIASTLLRRSQAAARGRGSQSITAPGSLPLLTALLYLWNPLSIIACVGGSSAVFEGTAVAAALAGAALANPVLAGAGVACAAYLSSHHLLLLIPLGMMLWRGPEDIAVESPPAPTGGAVNPKQLPAPEAPGCGRLRTLGGLGASGLAAFLLSLALAAACLAGLSNLVMASARAPAEPGQGPSPWVEAVLDARMTAEWVRGSYGFQLAVEDLKPNFGLWWYFVTEAFDAFRPFFVFVLHCQYAALAAPFALRFPNRPVMLTVLHCLTSAMLRPYPCVADLALYMALLPLLQCTLVHMRHSLLVSTAFIFIGLLEPAIWHMWIHSAVANANFYYAITLVLGATHMVLIADITGAAIRMDRLLAGKPLVPCAEAVDAEKKHQ